MAIPVGFFSDSSHPDSSGLALSSLQGLLDDETATGMAAYLEGGVLVAMTGGTRTWDALSADRTDIGPLALLTDGNYYWPSDLAYYVRVYQVGLPEDFVAVARARHWRVPLVSEARLKAVMREFRGH